MNANIYSVRTWRRPSWWGTVHQRSNPDVGTAETIAWPFTSSPTNTCTISLHQRSVNAGGGEKNGYTVLVLKSSIELVVSRLPHRRSTTLTILLFIQVSVAFYPTNELSEIDSSAPPCYDREASY